MEFAVCFEFAISRRIPWEGDEETLRNHVRDVRRRLAETASVEDVKAVSNLSTGNVSFEFSILGATRTAIERIVHESLGTAIRDTGAYHSGLFPAVVEMKMRPRLNPWSGLRTPTWRLRRSTIEPRRSVNASAAS